MNSRTWTFFLLFFTALSHADTMYIGTFSSVVKFDTSGQSSVFAPAFQGGAHSGPLGLAVDSSGNLFAAHTWDGTGGGRIFKLDPSGNISVFASGLSSPTVLAMDKSRNIYAATDVGSPAGGSFILKYDPAGNSSIFASGLSGVDGFAFDKDDNLFAAQGNTIFKFNPNGQQSVFATGLGGIYGLAFDASGQLYAGQRSGNAILKFSSNGSFSVFNTVSLSTFGQSRGVMGLAFDHSGDIYASFLLSNLPGGGTVLKFDSTGQPSLFASGLDRPGYIAVVPEPSVGVFFFVTVFSFLALFCKNKYLLLLQHEIVASVCHSQNVGEYLFHRHK